VKKREVLVYTQTNDRLTLRIEGAFGPPEKKKEKQADVDTSIFLCCDVL